MSHDSDSNNPYEPSDVTAQSSVQSQQTRWGKPFLLLVVATGIIVAGFFFRDSLSIASLAEKESQLRDYQSQHPVLVIGLALAIYSAATGFSIPGAAALTLVFGWYFGWWQGVLIVSFASTLGATIAFLMSRYFLSDWVQKRLGDRLAAFNQRFRSEGNFYLFTLRLIPAVPFFLINLGMGLTPIRVRDYWWISQLGMLPATMVYVYAGSRVPNLNVLAEKGASAVFSPAQLAQLTFAFALLGLFPLVVRWIMNRVQRPEA